MCFTPLRVKITGINKITGKKVIKFLSQTSTDLSTDLIPCGKCPGCKLDKANEWANRIVMESKSWENNYWFTLTYNDKNIQRNEKGIPTLNKKHIQKFMKDLRKYMKQHYNQDGIRFLVSGEYGTKLKRPHYHIVLFNLNLPEEDIYQSKITEEKMDYFRSKIIEKKWKKGFSLGSKLTWENAAYTARYTLKKATQSIEQEQIFKWKKINPEFINMSRNPGIARFYYEKNKEQIYRSDSIIIKTKDEIKTPKPPSYFDRLYEAEHPFHMQLIKNNRKDFIDRKNAKLELKKWQENNNAFEKKVLQIRTLIRNLEN